MEIEVMPSSRKICRYTNEGIIKIVFFKYNMYETAVFTTEGSRFRLPTLIKRPIYFDTLSKDKIIF